MWQGVDDARQRLVHGGRFLFCRGFSDSPLGFLGPLLFRPQFRFQCEDLEWLELDLLSSPADQFLW